MFKKILEFFNKIKLPLQLIASLLIGILLIISVIISIITGEPLELPNTVH